jgi:hypothetical protein
MLEDSARHDRSLTEENDRSAIEGVELVSRARDVHAVDAQALDIRQGDEQHAHDRRDHHLVDRSPETRHVTPPLESPIHDVDR